MAHWKPKKFFTERWYKTSLIPSFFRKKTAFSNQWPILWSIFFRIPHRIKGKMTRGKQMHTAWSSTNWLVRCCCYREWQVVAAAAAAEKLESTATRPASRSRWATRPRTCRPAPSHRWLNTHTRTRTHTHTHLTALCPGLPRWVGTRKVKPIWILLKQKAVSGGNHQQLNTHTYTATMHTCQHNRQQLRNTGPGVPTTTCSDEWSTAAVCAQKWIFFDCHVFGPTLPYQRCTDANILASVTIQIPSTSTAAPITGTHRCLWRTGIKS